MPNLIKVKDSILSHQKIMKTIGLIACLPFGLIIIDLLLKSIFNLGIYTGTFLRFLYDFVVY